MPTNRLPTPGQDSGNWGTMLNGFLTQSLDNSNGGGINKFEQFSQRPNNLTTEDKGKTYLYTQTGNFHQWTGTEWKVLNESVINVKDYGAIGDGVVDDTAALQFCLDSFYNILIPSGKFRSVNKIVCKNPRTSIKLDGELMLGNTMVFENGQDCTLAGNRISVSNDFPNGNHSIELGTSTSTARAYNFIVKLTYFTGQAPNGSTRAGFVKNYNGTFCDFHVSYAKNLQNFYTCDEPKLALGDNKVGGILLENCHFGAYLHGTENTDLHTEHHMFEWSFVAGALFGVVYARGRAHYQNLTGAFDFNGAGLFKVTLNSVTNITTGEVLNGSISTNTSKVLSIVGNEIIFQRLTGTFQLQDQLKNNSIIEIKEYGGTDIYIDFISATQSNFARHTINANFICDWFGNNTEDWIIFQAKGNKNTRATIAGHSFISSSSEQYVDLEKNNFSIRVQNQKILDWDHDNGLNLGAWSGSQTVKVNRNLEFPNSSSTGPHIVLGNYHLWVDSAGKFRMKNGQPTSDTDGDLVGSQS